MYNARTKPKYLNTMEPVFSVFDYLWWISVLWLLCVIRFEYDCQIMEVEVVHLGSSLLLPIVIDIVSVILPCPVLTIQTTFQIHWIYNKLSVSGPDYFVTCVGLFILECLQFTFTFGKSTEFLVGNLKWLPIILTHLARSRTDFSALF